jgi:hypothetical protein
MTLEFLLMSLWFNSFLLLWDKQNSKWSLFRCYVVQEDSRLQGTSFEQQQAGSKASDRWPYWSYIHTGLQALILLPKPHTLGIWVHTWLVMLSHAVMSVIQVFPSLWCWVWIVLLLRLLVFHPSWCELTVLRIDVVVWAWVGMVEMVGFCQVMWFVMLESAKDWILGIDTPGQQVLPRVWYGTACLLIRDDVGGMPCSDVWELV